MADLATLTVTLTGQVSPLQRALSAAERDTSRTMAALQSGASGAGRAMASAMSGASTTVTVALGAVQSGARDTAGVLSRALAAGASAGRAALSALGGAAHSAVAAMGSLAAKAGSVATGALRSLGRVAEYAAGQLVAMGVSAAVGQVRDALGEYADYERLSASLQSLVAREMMATGRARDMASAMQLAGARADELRRWIEQLAIESPFDQAGVAQAFRTALAYGFASDEAQRLTRVMIDFAAGTGGTTATMDRVALALGQIKAKGKLAGQELLQLTEAGLDVRDALARSLGKSRQEIEAMIEAGIDADTAISAIVNTLERDFGGAARRQAGTFAGLLSTLTDVRAVLRRSLLGPAFRAAQPALERFVASLQDPRNIARVEALGARLGQLTARALDLAASFQIGRSLWDAESGIGRLASRVRALGDWVASFAVGVVALLRGANWMGAVGDAMRALSARTGAAVSALSQTVGGRLMAMAIRALDIAREAASRAVDVVSGAVRALVMGGPSALLSHIARLAGDALSALVDIARARVIPAAIDALETLIAQARAAAPVVVTAVGDAIEAAAPRVMAVASRVISSAAGAAMRALGDIADGAGDLMMRAGDAIARRAPDLFARVSAIDWGGLLKQYLLGGAETPEAIVEWALRAAITAAGGLIGGALAGPAGAVAGGLLARWLVDLPVVQDLTKRASAAVVDAARWVGDRLREIGASPLWSDIAAKAQGVFLRIGELAAPFVARVSVLVQRVGAMLSDFLGRNQERFGRIAENFMRIVESISQSPVWRALYETIVRGFDWAAGLLERALDMLLRFADVVLAALAGDFGDLGQLLQQFLASAIDAARYLVEAGAGAVLRVLRAILAGALDLLAPFLAGIVGSLRAIPGAEQLFGAQIADAERAILAAPQALRGMEIAPMSQWQMPQINLTINAPSTDAREIADEAMRTLRLAMQVTRCR